MNNKNEEGDLHTCVEPLVSYYSSSSNWGITSFSNREIKSFNQNGNSLFTPFSQENSFSLCNTVMIHIITNKNEKEYNNNDYYNYNINESLTESKQKDYIDNSMKVYKTRNKTISSKGEIKENDDNIVNEKDMPKENLNLEKNPFFLGKNLSMNYLIDKRNQDKDNEFNSRYDNEKIEENNNITKIEKEEESKEGGECRTVNETNVTIKSILYKDKKKKDNSDFSLIKQKKTKIKETILNQNPKNRKKSVDKEQENLQSQMLKKRSSFFMVQSISYAEDRKKMPKKGRKNYLSNNNLLKNYNVNDLKSRKKSKNYEKIEEEENGNKLVGKTERNKHKKSIHKAPIRDNYPTSKLLKMRIMEESNLKPTKNQIISKQGLNLIKEHINYKEKEKEKESEDSSNDKSINIGTEKYKKGKSKKIKIRKSNEKEREYRASEIDEKKDLKTKTPNRRTSALIFKKRTKKKIVKEDNISEKQTIKLSKANKFIYIKDNEKLIKKEKDTISKGTSSIKDFNNKINKNKIKHCATKKDISVPKNTNEDKYVVNKCLTIGKKKRSISVEFDKSKLEEIRKMGMENKLQENPNTNMNNSISTANTSKNKKFKKKKFDFETALKKNSKKMQFNLFNKEKFTNTEISNSDYLKYTLNCMELIIEIDMEKQTRLKNKINFNFPKPKKKNAIKKKIALFDLDETLVHCTGDIKLKKEKYQHAIEIKLPGKQAVQVGINLRPYWKQTLRLIKKNYHIVVYTASHQAYADSVLDFMDPKKKYFKYRLYRNNCSLIDVEGAKFYVKDLDILNEYYDLKDIVIIDNSVLSFAFHLHNGIPIVPYYDEDKDGSLYVVGLYLIHIFPQNDLREANKTQINLDSFLEEAKRQKEEEENNIIDEESGDEEQEEKENKSEDDSKKNLFEIKKGEATNRTFKDNRNFAFTIKKKTLFDNVQQNRRRQSQDFTQKNLISQSRLLNMYYEVNNEAHIKVDKKIMEKNEENEDNDKSEISLIKLNDGEKGNEITEKEKPIIVVVEDSEGEGEGEGEGEEEKEKEKEKEGFNEKNDELDCKKEKEYPLIVENENNNNSDNDSISEENNQALRRGFTITGGKSKEKKEQNDINGKLNYIRSNFFNNFNI